MPDPLHDSDRVADGAQPIGPPPLLRLTNWSSRALHGPGRKLSIMARPRPWEHGDGRVPLLTPNAEDLAAVQSRTIDLAEYRRRFLDGVEVAFGGLGPLLGPGDLVFTPRGPATSPLPLVADGDTLCCACSREAAGRGACHRVWAADLLVRAGWRVLLDGRELG